MVLFRWLPQETQECMIKSVFKSCQAFPPPVKIHWQRTLTVSALLPFRCQIMSLALFFKHWDSGTCAVLSKEWPFLNIFARGKKKPFTFIYEMTVLLIIIIIKLTWEFFWGRELFLFNKIFSWILQGRRKPVVKNDKHLWQNALTMTVRGILFCSQKGSGANTGAGEGKSVCKEEPRESMKVWSNNQIVALCGLYKRGHPKDKPEGVWGLLKTSLPCHTF